MRYRHSVSGMLSQCLRFLKPPKNSKLRYHHDGPGEFQLVGPDLTAKIAHLFKDLKGYAALHLDHGDSEELVCDALKAGYTSVMLDYSRKSFEENTSALKRVVKAAAPLGVTVEGEIGAVGKVNATVAEGSEFSTLTDPEQALEYVKITGVDALAVSIGNAHGELHQTACIQVRYFGKDI